MILTLSAEFFDGMTDDERSRFWPLIYALSESPIDHALLLDPAEDVSAGRGPVAAWLAQESRYHQRVVRGLFERGPLVAALHPAGEASSSPGCWRRAGPLRVTVERLAASDWRTLRLTLADALALVQEPLHLYLENDRNDLAFVKLLCQPSDRRAFTRLEDAPARLFERGGGTSELKVRLERLAEKPTLDDVERRRLWKTWVMFDKDAGFEDATEPSADTLRLVGLCEEIHTKHGVPLSWVCLQRREIESYIPDEGLPNDTKRREARQWIAVARKTRGQEAWAWAYDMKNGLVGDLNRSVTKDRRALLKDGGDSPRQDELKRPFNILDDATRRALERGFGKKVLNGPLSQPQPPDWLDQLGEEYDRGPTHQLPRAALIRSIFDRM